VKRSLPRFLVIFHGAWTGWGALLLLVRSGIVTFSFRESSAGVVNYCTVIGYPKQQDYFWYAAMLVAGIAGMAINVIIWTVLKRRDWRAPWRSGLASILGLAMAMTTWLLLSAAPWGRLYAGFLLPVVWLFPWFFTGFHDEGVSDEEAVTEPGGRALLGWAAASLLVATAWCYDGCYSQRWIDGYHEGNNQLLIVQAYLSGDLPGANSRIFYSPLYHYSLIWWMKAFGLTISAERVYFIAAQVLGTAIHIFLLRLVCRGWPAVLTGAWLMLTLTNAPAIGYGWANSFRTALPLAALVLLWKALASGDRRVAALAGLLAACALLYSQEFGSAGFACSLVLIGFMVPLTAPVRQTVAVWAAAFLVSGTVIMLIVFGGNVVMGARNMLFANYMVAHLMGHDVLPLPAFPWFRDAAGVFRDLITVTLDATVWGPGFACVLAFGWLGARGFRLSAGRGPLFGALILLALMAQMPVLARPMAQIGTSMPFVVMVAAMLVDLKAFDVALSSGGPSRRNRLAIPALALWGLYICTPTLGLFPTRCRCNPLTEKSASGIMTRLGTVYLFHGRDEGRFQAIALINRLLVPGERIYVAAPFHTQIAFLSGHPGLVPFPSATMAATREERLAIVEALDRLKPRLALLTEMAIDVPFSRSHPEEWARIRRDYTLAEKYGDLCIFLRKGAFTGGALEAARDPAGHLR
jgi:hypothetical protein